MRERQVILVIGVPRSGSTWLTEILASAPDTDLVMEPDNEKTSALASFLKQRIPRFPRLSPSEDGPDALPVLWECAFRSDWAPLLSRGWVSTALCRTRAASRESRIASKGSEIVPEVRKSWSSGMLRSLCALPGPSSKARRIVKSVHAVLYPEWIVERCAPVATLIVMRHPMAVLQSWRRLQMPDARRLAPPRESLGRLPSHESPIAQMAWQLGVMYRSLRDATERNPDWHVIWHEALCEAPYVEFRAVAEKCGTVWDESMDQRIALMNRTGQGYKPRRDASKEIGKWKREAAAADLDAVKRVFGQFDLADLI